MLSVVVLFRCMAVSPDAVAAEYSHPCVAVIDDAARLACYDEAFGKREASPPAVSADTARSSAPAPEIAATAQFGFTAAQVEERAGTTQDELTAVVTHIDKRPTGELIATLDNGQVWVQREVSSRVRLKKDDKVGIRRAALGSYFLTTPDGVVTRVKRIE
jgi:hypothetical protein